MEQAGSADFRGQAEFNSGCARFPNAHACTCFEAGGRVSKGEFEDEKNRGFLNHSWTARRFDVRPELVLFRFLVTARMCSSAVASTKQQGSRAFILTCYDLVAQVDDSGTCQHSFFKAMLSHNKKTRAPPLDASVFSVPVPPQSGPDRLREQREEMALGMDL